MDGMIKYSVLRYSPSKVSGEYINLGMLIVDEKTGYCEFYISRKLSDRIASFTNKITAERMDELLRDIKKKAEEDGQKGTFNIEKYTEYFINDFEFEHPKEALYEDRDKTIDQLKNVFFEFDYA